MDLEDLRQEFFPKVLEGEIVDPEEVNDPLEEEVDDEDEDDLYVGEDLNEDMNEALALIYDYYMLVAELLESQSKMYLKRELYRSLGELQKDSAKFMLESGKVDAEKTWEEISEY